MIGKLKGTLVELEGSEGLIETSGGVYYLSYLTPEIIGKSRLGEKIEIYTYLNVKEDGLTLFGFEDKKKKRLFLMLLSVDGVGPKLAFSIISFTDADQIITAVKASDIAFFNAISGIGKKTAQKILLELSSKFDTEFEIDNTVLSQDDTTVIEALASLGFDKNISIKTLSKIEKGLSVENKIRESIKIMTKK